MGFKNVPQRKEVKSDLFESKKNKTEKIGLKEQVEEKYTHMLNTPSFNDTNAHITLRVNRELKEKFDRIAATKEKGWKVLAFNTIFKALLDEYDF